MKGLWGDVPIAKHAPVFTKLVMIPSKSNVATIFRATTKRCHCRSANLFSFVSTVKHRSAGYARFKGIKVRFLSLFRKLLTKFTFFIFVLNCLTRLP